VGSGLVIKRRGRILFSLLLLLFGVGVVPLVGTSYQLVSRSRGDLELAQKATQLETARSLSQQVGTYLKSLEAQVAAVARTLEVDVAPGQFAARVVRTAGECRDGLVRQVSGPVLWMQSVERLASEGVDTFVEVGPGHVLGGLIKKIAKAARVLHVQDPHTLDQTLTALGARSQVQA